MVLTTLPRPRIVGWIGDDASRRLLPRYQKHKVGAYGLGYYERLRHLNLCTLQESKNRQDLIEVF